MDLEALRFPIGLFEATEEVTAERVVGWIDDIERLPEDLRQVVAGLSETQLDTPYRPEGWTVRQVVHHLGDSHMNSLIRFKWALTEDRPRIKAYFEDRWARLADYESTPLETSLALLEHLHARWVVLLRSLGPTDLERRFLHPEMGEVVLGWNIGLYAWHGKHHLAHITSLIEREGWK